VFFWFLREYPNPPHEARPHRNLGDVLRQIPEVLGGEKNFRLFLVMRSLGQAHMILVPFLAWQFRKTLGLPEAFIGHLVQAQMLGGLLGNALAGYWGDRQGAKGPLEFSRLLTFGLCSLAAWVSAPWAALGIFFLLGVVINVNNISENMFLLEVIKPEKRPILISMQSILLMPVLILFGLVSEWLFQASNDLSAQALVAGLLTLSSYWVLRSIRKLEPTSVPVV
jgi:MFS family permease